MPLFRPAAGALLPLIFLDGERLLDGDKARGASLSE